MNLNQFAATKRLALFERLKQGLAPDEGSFSESVLAEAKVKGAPQMGSTRFAAETITFEFIYPDVRTSASVFTVTLAAPERIVFLPVPSWVIESIWQGEIFGSAAFESEANLLVAGFLAELEPGANDKHFAPRPATHRE